MNERVRNSEAKKRRSLVDTRAFGTIKERMRYARLSIWVPFRFPRERLARQASARESACDTREMNSRGEDKVPGIKYRGKNSRVV